MNIYKIRGLNERTAVAPIRIAIKVCYKDNKEYAYTMFRDVDKLLEAINDIDIKKYYIERIYLANNVGKEYDILDEDDLYLYDINLDTLPVYGALING